MRRGAASDYAGLPQHTTLQYPEDSKPPDARLQDPGPGTPNLPCPNS